MVKVSKYFEIFGLFPMKILRLGIFSRGFLSLEVFPDTYSDYGL